MKVYLGDSVFVEETPEGSGRILLTSRRYLLPAQTHEIYLIPETFHALITYIENLTTIGRQDGQKEAKKLA